MVAPAYQLVDQELIQKLTGYAENGGNLVLTCRTGEKDRRGQLWEALWAEPIYQLIGAKIPFYDLLPPPVKATSAPMGSRTRGVRGARYWSRRPGTTVLATYSDQFYAGKPAAVTRKLGKGSVTYIGVDSETGELEMALLRKVYAGASPASLHPDFLVDWRDGFWVATNFTSTSQADSGEGRHADSDRREGRAAGRRGGVAVRRGRADGRGMRALRSAIRLTPIRQRRIV